MMLPDDVTVENYIVTTMGCTPISTGLATIRAYMVFEGLEMRLTYHYPIGDEKHMYIGSVEWLHLNEPVKKMLFSSVMPADALCRFLTMSILEYSFK